MPMLSLPKILLTLIVVVVAWKAYRWWQRVEAQRIAKDRRAAAEADARQGIQETRPCPACGVYVPVGAARACGRADCPYSD